MYQVHKLFIIFLATGLLSQPALADEEPLTVVVVSKTGSAQYKVGSVLNENSQIKLKTANDSLHLRKQDEPDGHIVKLKGVINKALKSFRDLFTIDRSSILENPWWFDVFQDDNVCYVSPVNLHFWRADTQRTVRLILRNKLSGKIYKERWYRGDETLPWPVQDMSGDVTYSIIIKGKQQREIAFHQVPPVGGHPDIETNSPSNQAVWMNKQGCSRQAKVLSSPSAN